MTKPEVQLWPNFLPAQQTLFEALMREIVWDDSMQARKTASFGEPYNYSQMSYPRCAFPENLAALLPHISEKIGFMPNNCLVNFYPDGSAKMGFHFDSLEPLETGTGVAILSLGDTRTLVFRRRDDKTVETSFELAGGSLLYMPPNVQNEWLHAVPQSEGSGPRLSLTFRCLKT